MTSLSVATLGASHGISVGLIESGGAGVALPCAAGRRFLHKFFLVLVGSFSPRVSGVIREVNETGFALNLLKTGGIGRSELCDEVE